MEPETLFIIHFLSLGIFFNVLGRIHKWINPNVPDSKLLSEITLAFFVHAFCSSVLLHMFGFNQRDSTWFSLCFLAILLVVLFLLAIWAKTDLRRTTKQEENNGKVG